jgi:cell wall-associated NlpC family hydrolase
VNDLALRRLVGIPYEFRGDGARTMDCWQLVVRAARDLFGRDYPAYQVERLRDVPLVVRAHLDEWTEVDEPRAGDVVLLSHHLLHCGIMLDGVRFLHTMKGRDSSIERIDSLLWKHRVLRSERTQQQSFRRYGR